MDETAKQLERETRKWLRKLEEELQKPGSREFISQCKNGSKPARESIENMQAYVMDCRHFLEEKRDFIRAFEAVIYAWGIWSGMRICLPFRRKHATE